MTRSKKTNVAVRLERRVDEGAGGEVIAVEAIDESGQQVGVMRAGPGRLGRWRDGAQIVRVHEIAVNKHLRRRGIGTRLYARAATLACRRFHAPLASNVLRSDDSEAFWQRQVRKGRAECLQWPSGPAQEGKPCAEYILSCPPPRSLAGMHSRGRR
jgi:GNAT superfamily N-acetyltransferase